MKDNKEEIKKTLAKVLLITQLFSPIGIKFTTKNYKNLANICTKTVNKLVIENTNPFKEYNSILEEVDHEDKVEQVLQAVELNANISLKEKKQVEAIRNFLKDNPYIDFNLLYSMLGNLEIHEQKIENNNFLMLTLKQYYVSEDATYKERIINEDLKALEVQKEKVTKSNIIINSNRTFTDDGFMSSFFHELVHLTGDFSTLTNNGKRIGKGLTEGLVSLIERDYFDLEEKGTGYFFVRTCAKLIAEIIGEEKLLECYSKNDLVSLIMAFEDKGIDNNEVVDLILNLDKIVSLEEISELDKEVLTKVIVFFKNYNNKIEIGPKSYICSSYIYDLELYKENPYSMYENDVKKFYYNSKEKDRVPYYIDKVIYYEELEYLNERFNIVVLSPNFENKDEVKEVLVKVYIDDKFKSLDEEKSNSL